ncbi:MAG: hypothetical protein KC668_24430, partial [Myxococcales bacterium]|nr:hypothetical protein [Myxococcales bacterium]
MNATRRERLDAILDAGLVHAPEEEQAWLAIEREADASFDAEVRELLALTDEVLAWGIRAAESGSASSPLDGALAAIFEGIDAGLYDDELRLDDAAGLADGLAGDPGDAEGMAPAATGVLRSGERLRAPRPVAPVAEAPAARATSSATRAESSAGAGRVVRLLRDNRLAQVLAAAAAVLVVVSAGFSAVSVVNRQPDASAIQGAPMAAAPAPTVAPMPTAAPAAAAFEAPSAEAEPEAAPLEPPAPTEALAGETLDAVPAPAPPSAPVAQLSDDGVAGGLSLGAEAQTAGTLREVDDSDTGRTTARSADRSRMATASSTSVSPASMSASGSAARPQGSVRYVDDFFASSPDGPQREIVAESAGE